MSQRDIEEINPQQSREQIICFQKHYLKILGRFKLCFFDRRGWTK